MSMKAFFVGGVAHRTGTTLMQKLLGRHRDIASFGESKLIDHQIFKEFPRWPYECPQECKADLIENYKKLCVTRYKRIFNRRLKAHAAKKYGALLRQWNYEV